MKIRKMAISHFRGIKHLEWNLPDERVICLIGKGDSAKSTILDAIRCTFSSQWNLPFSDADFYLGQTNNAISIEIVIGDFPDEFCSEHKYGPHLRGWDIGTSTLHDEPEDHDEIVLSVRLTIENDLEPKWTVVTGRNPEGVEFKTKDRAKLNVGLIGLYSDKELTWAVGTTLAKITKSKNLGQALFDASRAARTSLEGQREAALKEFDDAAAKSERVARSLGVPVDHAFQSHLDPGATNIKIGSLALHDGNVPLRQLGLGSRRMLQCGLQKENLEASHVTLFDELEHGLEPHRIARLINHIKGDITGQYFLTTHAPTVLRELNVQQLHIVHRREGVVEVVAAACEGFDTLNIQGHLRSNPEAFLSKKIIIGEGATEVGFLRGLDSYWSKNGDNSFSFHGVVLLDAKGAGNLKPLAKGFNALQYEVCIVADGDAPKLFSAEDAEELTANGVTVFMWSENLALEQRAMLDLPWSEVLATVKLAQGFGFSVHANVHSKLGSAPGPEIDDWQDGPALRRAIGNAANAKDHPWFKCISDAQDWVDVIAPAFDAPEFKTQELAIKLNSLRAWVDDER